MNPETKSRKLPQVPIEADLHMRLRAEQRTSRVPIYVLASDYLRKAMDAAKQRKATNK